jgi:hypothetical protein
MGKWFVLAAAFVAIGVPAALACVRQVRLVEGNSRGEAARFVKRSHRGS